MRLVFDVHGERQIDRRLVRYELNALDATPAWEVIYKFMLRVEKSQFDTEGQQSDHPWPALAESTLRQKQRLGLRPEILRATDALMNSLTREGDEGQLKIINPNFLAFGSNLQRAVWHQSGTVHMPQRRPVDFTETNKVAIVKALQLWLARGVAPEIGAMV